ncbi:MAG TPA: T9SS type A sorting domain-containing protein [Ignavibacteria bacterium]|nr:T9SS type A sorting domain-containing protein [Ignavibacteria bacterium]
MGNPVNIATVGSSTMSYIDQEYIITSGYTDDLLYYDVRGYFSLDQTYADPSYLSIFGKQGIIAPIANKGNEGELFTNIIKKNSLDNYPNPFNPSTNIQYQLKEGGFVSIRVYDYLGREVAVLVNKAQPSGRYSVTFNASDLSSGVYFYKIDTNNFHKVKKMILMK